MVQDFVHPQYLGLQLGELAESSPLPTYTGIMYFQPGVLLTRSVEMEIRGLQS